MYTTDIGNAPEVNLFNYAHQLVKQGFRLTIMHNHMKHPLERNYYKFQHPPTPDMTGIGIVIGKNFKNGFYTYCIDIDIYDQSVRDDILSKILQVIKKDVYFESTPSGGCHIIFFCDSKIKAKRKYTLENSSKAEIELFTREKSYVIIAPSMAKNKHDNIGKYQQTSEVDLIHSAILSKEEMSSVVEFLNSLSGDKKINGSIESGRRNSQRNIANQNYQDAEEYIYRYGSPSEINKLIKISYPNMIELLDFLDIDHAQEEKEDYLRFFSLAANDGNNPDASLYHNRNNTSPYRWSGYSVKDYHFDDDGINFAKYLCKYDREKFDKLMRAIGFNNSPIDIPIQTKPTCQTVEFSIANYPSENQADQILQEINTIIRENIGIKQTKIVLTAPTGTGKTEMFYRLAEQQKIKMIMALPYTSQVSQGKTRHTVANVLTGLCGNDCNVSKIGSIFMTYDKFELVAKELGSSLNEYILIIDEAHNLVNQISFRKMVLTRLKSLSSKCKAVVYMTATPDYINYHDVDLMIKIKTEIKRSTVANVVKYHSKSKEVLSNIVLNQHVDNKIDMIYARNTDLLYQLSEIISKNSGLNTNILYSRIKNESQAYKNIIEKGELLIGDVLFTTNLIIDGVNIEDKNIGNIYLLDPIASTDLIQFPSRFRNGFNRYFIMISGNKTKFPPINEDINRQNLVERYYRIAAIQKKINDSFRSQIESVCKTFGTRSLYLPESKSYAAIEKIQLSECLGLLDVDGNISDGLILEKVQTIETLKMRGDISLVKEYMEKPEYGFSVNEVTVEDLIKSSLSPEEIKKAEQALAEENRQCIEMLRSILVKGIENDDCQELLSEYIRNNKKYYSLGKRIGGKDTQNTEYKRIIQNRSCHVLLDRYCMALEFNATHPMDIINNEYSNDEIYSIRRAHHNLMIEYNRDEVKKDDKYFRYFYLREFIIRLKRRLDCDIVVLAREHLCMYVEHVNKKFGNIYTGDIIKKISKDMSDIFDLEVTKKRNKNGSKDSFYMVDNEWTMNNIRGMSFSCPS